MKTFIAILIAAVCGAGIGAGAAVLKFRQYPWSGGPGAPAPPSGGHVVVDEDEFDFGRMDISEDGKHEFNVTNRGEKTLTLNAGASSCSCTLSEIKDSELPPGQATTVTVKWHSKRHAGQFRQFATVMTSDALRPEIRFTIHGDYFTSLYVDPDELTFGQIAANQPVTHEARILCSLPNQEIKVLSHHVSDSSLDKFFQVDYAPLGADELRNHKGITSGVLVRITVKPGLPLGSFQQRIFLNTNLNAFPEVEIPVFGSVGELTLVGPGWNSETEVLNIGEVDGRSGAQRQLILLARGPSAREMKFKVASVEPDYLNVKLGKTTVIDTGELSKTELLIDIPKSKDLKKDAPANFLGGKDGKLAEIALETIEPPVRALRIRVRFAVVAEVNKP